MPEFGKTSLERLATCDKRLQEICTEVMEKHGSDFTVLCGHRGKEEQERLFNEGKSRVTYPNSKHNSNPSLAVDIAPYPVDWSDTKRFYLLAGLMFASARYLGYKIRWGGDWDRDFDFNDQNFNDLPHFEIVE